MENPINCVRQPGGGADAAENERITEQRMLFEALSACMKRKHTLERQRSGCILVTAILTVLAVTVLLYFYSMSITLFLASLLIVCAVYIAVISQMLNISARLCKIREEIERLEKIIIEIG